MSTANARLNKILEETGNTYNSLAKAIGLKRSQNLYDIRDGKVQNISFELASKIHAVYSQYTVEWLMNGEGKMSEQLKREIIPVGKVAHIRHNPDAFSEWQGLPMYNAPITASFVASYRDEMFYQPQYYLHDPRFRDCNFGAIITGDSMHSEIRHGDFVVCQEITDPSFIVFGDIYYVVATNGLETCKYLNADPDNPDNYLLIARNERISPSPIPKSKILKLFKVRGIVRGY